MHIQLGILVPTVAFLALSVYSVNVWNPGRGGGSFLWQYRLRMSSRTFPELLEVDDSCGMEEGSKRGTSILSAHTVVIGIHQQEQIVRLAVSCDLVSHATST